MLWKLSCPCGSPPPRSQCAYSSLRVLPNPRETHHLTGKWVTRSVGHLLDNLVKIQTKLLFRFHLFDETRVSFVLEKPDKKKKNQRFHRWENWSTTYQQQSLEKSLEKSAITFCLFLDIFAVFSLISGSICYLYQSHFPHNLIMKLKPKPTFLSLCFNKQLIRSW